MRDSFIDMPSSPLYELQENFTKSLGTEPSDQVSGKFAKNEHSRNKLVSRKQQRRAGKRQKNAKQYLKTEAANSLHTVDDFLHKSVLPMPSQPDLGYAPTHNKATHAEVWRKGDNKCSDIAKKTNLEVDSEVCGKLLSVQDSEQDMREALQGRQVTHKSEMRLSRNVRDKLAQDDAEIAAFERKLGLKDGRKSLPQSFVEDGLDDLIGDLEQASDESSDYASTKRKRDFDDWLSLKRQKKVLAENRKATGVTADNKPEKASLQRAVSPSAGNEPLEDASNDVYSFIGPKSSENDLATQSRRKENPYVAPITRDVATYVPPILREQAHSENQNNIHLRKHIQGLINRLTDSNLLSIVQLVDEAYSRHARGDVTELLTDAILAQICKPDNLPDQFFVLIGGFTAALYQIIGTSLGGHVLRVFIQEFGQQYDRSGEECEAASGCRKTSSNLLTFISQLYMFEVITCKVLFDYMERLLGDFNDFNIELLLRICRMTGHLLRRDDATALKHIAITLNRKVAELGTSAVSARALFMIETIADIKKNKSKAKGRDSSIVSDHVVRMKKRLGELKSRSRRQNGLAPMGMGLQDVEHAETFGKWWLVGASMSTQAQTNNRYKRRASSADVNEADLTDDEDMDRVFPDYPGKARAQGLSSTTQIAIFTAIMSAFNHEQGYRQFVALGLKKDDQLGVARVLVQCAGSESPYNPYYALVGQQACTNPRIRFAFQDTLWNIFRCFEESIFGEQADEIDSAESKRMKDEERIATVAQFYASLVAGGSLGLRILKPLNFPELSSWTKIFVQHLMVRILQDCISKTTAKEDRKVEKIFGGIRGLPALAAGIVWFLRRISKNNVLTSRHLHRVRGKAEQMVKLTQEG